MPAEEQVIILWTATKGYLDRVELKRIAAFEKEFLDYIKNQHPGILKKVSDTKELDEKTEAQLETAVQTFLENFAPAKTKESGKETKEK